MPVSSVAFIAATTDTPHVASRLTGSACSPINVRRHCGRDAIIQMALFRTSGWRLVIAELKSVLPVWMGSLAATICDAAARRVGAAPQAIGSRCLTSANGSPCRQIWLASCR